MGPRLYIQYIHIIRSLLEEFYTYN